MLEQEITNKVVEEKTADDKAVEEQKSEEKVVDEISADEQADVEKVTEEKEDDAEVEQTFVGDKSIEALIEEKREPLMNLVKKNRRLSNIISYISIPLVLASTFFIFTDKNWIGWILIVVALALMISNYVITKKQMDGKYREFIDFMESTLISEMFKDPKYEEIKKCETAVELKDFENNGVYRDLVRIATRNNYSGKYGKMNFKYSETAIFKRMAEKKNHSIAAFCGKILDIENSLGFEGNYIINIDKEEAFDVPNDLGERTKLYEKDRMTVYGNEGADFRAVLGEQFIGNLKKLALNEHLINVAVAISSGRTLVFLSYDDDVMILPGERKLKVEAFDSSIKDVKNALDVMNLLGK